VLRRRIIYSDPADDGYARGTYPEGPWGPESHIQWGAILYDWLGQGEPFTFHWKQQPDGRWVEARADKQLPRIPSIPMSHEDASQILSRLTGTAGPRVAREPSFHVSRRSGTGHVELRVKNEDESAMRNVIGKITGSEEPEVDRRRQSPRRLEPRRRHPRAAPRRSRDRARPQAAVQLVSVRGGRSSSRTGMPRGSPRRLDELGPRLSREAPPRRRPIREPR
jgi:hypothetical protein